MITTLSKIHFHPTSNPTRTAYWSRAMLCSETRWAFEFHLRGEFHKCLFASATRSHSRTGEEWRRALWVITHFSFEGGFTDEVGVVSLHSLGSSSSLCSWFLWFCKTFYFTLHPPASQRWRPTEYFIDKFQIRAALWLTVVAKVTPALGIKSHSLAIVLLGLALCESVILQAPRTSADIRRFKYRQTGDRLTSGSRFCRCPWQKQ